MLVMAQHVTTTSRLRQGRVLGGIPLRYLFSCCGIQGERITELVDVREEGSVMRSIMNETEELSDVMMWRRAPTKGHCEEVTIADDEPSH